MEVDRLLKRLHKNKPELLMVLDRERRGPQGDSTEVQVRIPETMGSGDLCGQGADA